MNELYEAAKKRLAEIREEERTLNEFIVSHERARRVLVKQGEQGNLFERALVPSTSQPLPIRALGLETGQRVINPRSSAVIGAAITILREGGRPLSRRQLHGALAERGLDIKGGDPIKALGTILWRGRDKLVQLQGFGYWPIDDPYETAGYRGR